MLSGKTVSMVKSCSAVGCQNRSVKGTSLSFYRFPSDPERRAKWIAAVRRDKWFPTEHSWLCSAHFVSGRKCDDPLSPDFVPSIFEYLSSPVKRKRKRELDDYERRKKARLARGHHDSEAGVTTVASPDSSFPLYHVSEAIHTEPVPSRAVHHVGTQTDLSAHAILGIEEECQILRNEKSQLERALRLTKLTEETFKSDDEPTNDLVKFYTGLPSRTVLMAVFNHVSAHVKKHCRSIPLFEQFLMVLMKLRLNLCDEDLGHRFGVSQSTVSKTFKRWINILYVRLQPLIRWPTRDELKDTMPLDFKNDFPKCVCVIDCFEVFCERPRDLKARAQTYSNYKHHNTVKFLIAISPQGVISYISQGWGGRVSDKHLTENCGILEKLLPGDQILADRGFNIQDSVGLFCAEIAIPPFTKGKKQLSRLEIDTARKLSRVRIHVERVIGVLRQKYTILESTLAINMIRCNKQTEMSMIDKIVTVCSALCNCCESVVPFS